jgi:predicted phosphodiesterase
MIANRQTNLPQVVRRFVIGSYLPLLLVLFAGSVLVQLPDWGALASAQEPTSITFAAIGDFGSNDANELDVANLVKSWNPDFIITLGDNNYPDGEAATIDASIGKYYREFIYPYVGSYGEGGTTNRFWPSIGNRDWDNQTGAKLKPYLDYFTLPNNERYYDFVRGPVHFFVIDSDADEPDGITSTSIQAQWLRNKLAASTAAWKIVYFHHPPYSSRTSWSNLQWPFQTWGASAVLSGHAHVYERVMKDGIPFFTNGLGGDSTGSFNGAIAGSVVRFGDDYGAMRITASATAITYEFITRRGVVIDTYTVGQPPPAAPAAPGSLTASAAGSSQINLGWTDNANNEDGVQIERCVGTGCTDFAQIAQVGTGVTTYNNTELAASTTYRYRVRAFNGNGNSGYSNVAEAVTPAAASIPADPTNLGSGALSNNQINLSWTDNANNENGFHIESCTGAACANFAQIAQVGANVTSYANSGLAVGTTYRYRVRAFNAQGNSGYSNVAEATTTSSQSPFAAPSNLIATAVSTSQIDIVWTDNSTVEDGFKLYRSTDGTTFSRTATLGPNVTSFSNTGRPASTTYHYRVLAFNASGNTAFSNTATATTFAPATVIPAAPSNLVATALSSTQVRLTWTDNSNNENAFKLYRSLNGTTFTEIAKPGVNSTSFIDAGLSSNTTYYYRIRSYNHAGSSAYSNIANARTP